MSEEEDQKWIEQEQNICEWIHAALMSDINGWGDEPSLPPDIAISGLSDGTGWHKYQEIYEVDVKKFDLESYNFIS
jgi:hypothetical protein